MTNGGAPIRPIGYWVKTVDRLIDTQFDEALAEHDVTRRQWQLLSTRAAGPRTVTELDNAVAPFLADAAETSAGHLAPLLGRGLVAGEDARYALTPAGETATDALRGSVGRVRTQLVAGLDPGEYERTVATLEKMARALGWRD
ncbi:MAG: MarR family winged helix-turn-helix transcriptional regulator [Lapillicoccus sp.]